MPDITDVDLTLPSVVASLPGKYRDQALVLTIIFHPRTNRIGQTAVVPRQTGDGPWILGRYGPVFTGGEGPDALPLEDRHVSRRALEFHTREKQLVVRRPGDTSRCRVAGSEFDGSLELSREQLREGVPLMLGHSVVLLLRLGQRSNPVAVAPVCGDLLRGSSAYMDVLRQQIVRAAGSDLDVLVRGETGTGKELVAAAIHGASPRASASLVSVNMPAIPVELAAAALFGSARGAFTGADKASAGYFGQAQGGSLFLDEIGDTPAQVQPQLLRALQQREIQAVGGAIRRVDVRVISATDAALEGDGCDFKAALRHRLGALEISLLPLREHPEDIGELLLHFLVTSAAAAQRPALLLQEQSCPRETARWAGLFYSFLRYHWPGNIRELANFAQQVVLASDSELVVADNVKAAMVGAGGPQRVERPVRRKMQDVGEEEFDKAMQVNCFELTAVAEQLGVSRTSVCRHIDGSSLHRLATSVPPDELQRVLAEHQGNSAAAAMQLRVSLKGLRARLRQLQLEWH